MTSSIEDQDDSLFATPAAPKRPGHLYGEGWYFDADSGTWKLPPPPAWMSFHEPRVDPVYEFTRLDGTEVKVYYAWAALSTDGYYWTILDREYLQTLHGLIGAI